MQKDLESTHPELQIQLLGVNEWGHGSANAVASANSDLPLLQDVDANEDFQSDVWTSWEVTWRDVFIVDAEGEVVDIINLTVNDLRNSDNYDELKDLILETAETAEPAPAVGDCNADGNLDAADLGCVSDLASRDAALASLGTVPGDIDGDGEVGFADFLILSSNFGNEETSYANGDIDLSGEVDFADFLILADNFGNVA